MKIKALVQDEMGSISGSAEIGMIDFQRDEALTRGMIDNIARQPKSIPQRDLIELGGATKHENVVLWPKFCQNLIPGYRRT